MRYALLSSLLLPVAAWASPFPTRDQNPLLAGFGIPMPLPVDIAPKGEWNAAADFNWGSSAIVQTTADETLMVDAETRELRLTVGHSFADRWTLQLQLPYRYTGGGSLDSSIDNWHDFFGLSEGQRPLLPHDQMHVAYERHGILAFDTDSSSQGIGDASADLGYQWITTTKTSVAAWFSLKVPTGDAEKFNGSGATDIALSLAGERRFANIWSAFGQVSATYLGDGDLMTDQQRSVVWSAVAGAGVDVWRALQLKLQLEAHTAAFDDTDLDYLGDAAILTFGGAWKFKSGWMLDFGISEDIVVDASPDVVVVMGVRRAY